MKLFHEARFYFLIAKEFGFKFVYLGKISKRIDIQAPAVARDGGQEGIDSCSYNYGAVLPLEKSDYQYLLSCRPFP